MKTTVGSSKNVTGTLLKRHYGRACPIDLKGRLVVPWDEIAEWISKDEGRRFHRQQIQTAFNVSLEELKERFLEDPVIREYLLSHGLFAAEEDKKGES